jgi:hypothetical protein
MYDPNGHSYGLIGAVIVLALIVRRTLTRQTIHVWSLIVFPLLLAVVAIGSIAATPVTVTAIGASIVGALAGGGFGYLRGRHSRVEIGPRPGTIVVQGNIVLALVLVAAFAIRYAVMLSGMHGPTRFAFSDAFIAFAAMSLIGARAMLFFAWRRLRETGAASAVAV